MIDPEKFAYILKDIGHKYNDAYIVPEANNHGILTVAVLDKVYPVRLIHRNHMTATGIEEKQLHGLGYRTTARNKPLMIGRLRTILAHELTIHSPLLKTQLSTFIEHEDGKLAAADGCQDDTVMSMACAVVGINPASLFASASKPQRRKGIDPFDINSMLSQLRGREEGYPIRSQTELEIN
jgi:hypothetical protein